MEFEYVIQNLTKLEYLQLFKQGNTLQVMTDASLNGLRFVLFQKDSEGKISIVQVGSTCQEYYSDSQSDEEGNTDGYKPSYATLAKGSQHCPGRIHFS